MKTTCGASVSLSELTFVHDKPPLCLSPCREFDVRFPVSSMERAPIRLIAVRASVKQLALILAPPTVLIPKSEQVKRQLGAMGDVETDSICPHTFNCSGAVSLDIGRVPTYLSLASSSLSCFGSFLILLTYVLLRDMRTGAQKVITLLAVADFFTAFGYVIGGVNFLQHFNVQDPARCRNFHTVCEIQSFITTWSTMCSYLWTSILAFYFFLVLVFNKVTLAGKLIPLYNVLAWAGPLTIMLPLLLTDSLGYAPFVASNWCYIKDNQYSRQNLQKNARVISLILVGGKLWEVMTYVWISVLYVLIRIKVSRRINRLSVAPVAGRVELRLLAIPIMYIVCRMWGTLQFFYSLGASAEIQDGCVPSAIHLVFLLFGYFQAVGDGAQGWANAILYIFLSPVIRNRLFIIPFNKCLNVSIEKAAHFLESDSDSRATNFSERGKHSREAKQGHSGKQTAKSRQNVSGGTSDTTYHSFPTEEESSPLQMRRTRQSSSVQRANSPVFASLYSAGVSRDGSKAEGHSSTYLYESMSQGDSQFGHSRTPETFSDSR